MKRLVLFLVLSVSFVFAGDKVSAYLQGTLQDVESVKSKLTNSGFTVLSSSKINESGTLTTIVYTNDSLKAMGNSKTRGFMSTLRVLVDSENNQLSFSNPAYFIEAFMQGEGDSLVATSITSKLSEAFGPLSDSKDSLDRSKLAKYHFMFGMPYYDDMDIVGSGSAQNLLAKLKSSGKLVFSQTLSNDRILVGVNLSSQTSKFVDTIGTNNALVLPYPILLEDGKAKVLAPKYYLAISYPKLSMSKFMTISDIPGKIIEDCKALLR